MPDAAGETRIPAPESRRGAATDLSTRPTCRLDQVAGATSRQIAAIRRGRNDESGRRIMEAARGRQEKATVSACVVRVKTMHQFTPNITNEMEQNQTTNLIVREAIVLEAPLKSRYR